MPVNSKDGRDSTREWAISPDGSSNVNTISCEPCRHKKRKCDRLLPVCTLCSTSSTQCQYPERGKRGMPIGYITQLEERLNEAEAALFKIQADHELHKLGRPLPAIADQESLRAITDHYGSLSRQERINLWQRHHLYDDNGRAGWWHEINEDSGLKLDVPTQYTKAETRDNLLYTSPTTSPHGQVARANDNDILRRIPEEEKHKYF